MVDNGGCRVLIVEDDEHIRRFVAINLERNGFSVAEADNGTDARNRFAQDLPDVVLLDIMLPDADGFELCGAFRSIAPATAIVLLTARGRDEDKIKGLELGADDYIVKPFNPLELVARIRTILRRTRMAGDPRQSVLADGDIRIDLDANKASKSGRDVDLTPKEFLMAKALMERPNRALTRDELLNLVWGEDFVGDTKTVDVHIRKLREKLEDDASRPKRIETVWGVGYLWKKED